MISYALKCSKDHRFDSWFQSAAAFDKLKAAGMVTCSVCGDSAVEKAIMAPRVATSEAKLSTPASPAEQAMAEMRKYVEENATDVGKNFAKEARAMHDGEAPERAIYGVADAKEAKALIDDGVPVAPLPFIPKQKAN